MESMIIHPAPEHQPSGSCMGSGRRVTKAGRRPGEASRAQEWPVMVRGFQLLLFVVFLPHSNQKGKDSNRNREGSGHMFGQHEDMANGAWGGSSDQTQCEGHDQFSA